MQMHLTSQLQAYGINRQKELTTYRTLHASRRAPRPVCASEQQQLHPEQQQRVAEADIRQLLTRRSYAPARFVGPVQIAHVPGKRFGLTATRNLAVGDLLLVSTPLAIAYGPAGSAPGNEQLLQQLEGQQLDPWQLQWIRALHRSSSEAEKQQQQSVEQQQQEEEQQQQQLLSRLQQLLLQGPDDAAAPPPAAAAPAPGLSVAAVTCPFSPDELQQVISENAYSEAAEDLGASLLRELDPEAITGLWPEHALLNHSCAPNTLALCVGQYLILRLTAPVLLGEELCCSYLGKLTLSPVSMRRAYLQGVYGFHCCCARCIAEQRTFPTQYYPADDAALMGSSNPSSSSSSSSSNSSDGGGALARLFGGKSAQQQQQQQSQPRPSSQHKLLQQLYEEVLQVLEPAVQDAVASDSRRQEKQLQLLANITSRIDAAAAAVQEAAAADALLQQQQGTVARWLLAAVYPLLQLQVELLELLLASGDLPVDDQQQLLDEGGVPSTSTSNSTSRSSSSRSMAAAGAAAAARLSLSRRDNRKRQRVQAQAGVRGLSGLSAWFSGLWTSVLQPDEAAGPVTKRQLLGLYAEGLGQCLEVLDAVARGSEAHVVVSIKHSDAVRQLAGAEAEATALAEALCGRAHAARYGVLRGPEGQVLLSALIRARRRQLLGQSLARKMSVLAWESSLTRE